MYPHPLLAVDEIDVQHPTLGLSTVVLLPWALSMQVRPVVVQAATGMLSCYLNVDGMLISPAACSAIGASWERLDPAMDIEQITELASILGVAVVAMTLSGGCTSE